MSRLVDRTPAVLATRDTPHTSTAGAHTHTRSTKRYPRVLTKVKDTYTLSPDGADLAQGATQGYPRWSKTRIRFLQMARTLDLAFLTPPWPIGVVRLKRSYEVCYFAGPGWHNLYPKADRRCPKAPIWVGTAEVTGECVIAVPRGLAHTAHTHNIHGPTGRLSFLARRTGVFQTHYSH